MVAKLLGSALRRGASAQLYHGAGSPQDGIDRCAWNHGGNGLSVHLVGGRVVQHTATVVARVSDLGVTRQALDELVADRTPVRPGTSPQPALFSNPELGVHFG